MQLLLDTHTLIWMGAQPDRFTSQTAALLEDESNSVYASIVSLWELAIKTSIGKLDLGNDWLQNIEHYMKDNTIENMPVKPQHCNLLTELPLHHRDPFDRMLIAQAQYENLALVTADKHIHQYDIEVIW